MRRKACTNADCLMPCCDLCARPPSGPLRLRVRGWTALKTGTVSCGRSRPATEAKLQHPECSELAGGLRTHKKRQAEERLVASGQWNDRDLVFSTRTGAALDA